MTLMSGHLEKWKVLFRTAKGLIINDVMQVGVHTYVKI